MPSQRYKVEGTVTIQFEAELSADDIGFFDDDEAQSAIEDHIDAHTSRSFLTSKIIVYQSTTDVVTLPTQLTRIRADNLSFIRIGPVGWHDIGSIVKHFSRNSRYTQSVPL